MEQNDPDCSEHPGSADAEPREEARPPRSPVRAHPGSSSPALRSEHAADPDSSQRSLRSHQKKTLLLLLIYRLDAIFPSGLHSRSRSGGSARHQRLSIHIPDSSRLQARISSRGGHRDDAHRSGATSPPSCGVRGCFFVWSLPEDHQGAPSAGWGVRSHGDPG